MPVAPVAAKYLAGGSSRDETVKMRDELDATAYTIGGSGASYRRVK
jgi:hypothetical protein